MEFVIFDKTVLKQSRDPRAPMPDNDLPICNLSWSCSVFLYGHCTDGWFCATETCGELSCGAHGCDIHN